MVQFPTFGIAVSAKLGYNLGDSYSETCEKIQLFNFYAVIFKKFIQGTYSQRIVLGSFFGL